MATRISDLRECVKCIEDARVLFDRLAQIEIDLAAKDAAFEKRVAKLKAEHEIGTKEQRKNLADDAEALAKFIEQNKTLFVDPRKSKTSFGAFGLQTVSELSIYNETALSAFVREAKFTDCYIRVITLVKKAIKKRIESGASILGARVVTGDTAVYKVEKTLIDQARESALL